MMATTHGLAGLALALGVLGVAGIAPGSDAGATVLAAGFAGGLFPDADLYAGHRRRLHYPVLFPAVALVALGVAILFPATATIAASVFLAAAALHCGMDVLGGGLELRPWRATSERAVYDHVRGRWVRPRRWVRYDGAPEDLGLAALFAAPALLVATGPVRRLAVAALAVSAAYVLLRRHTARATAWLAARAPDGVRAYLPERFFEDASG